MFEIFGKKIIQRRLYVVIVWVFMIFISLPFAPQAQKYLKPGGFSNENFPSVEARKLMQEKMEVSTIAFDLVFHIKIGHLLIQDLLKVFKVHCYL